MASEESSESTSDRLQRPFSQASITAVLVAISNWAIENPQTEGMAAVTMPIISYGIVSVIRIYRKKQRLKKLCEVIDGLIAEKTVAKNKKGLSKTEKQNLESEIADLKKTKDKHLLEDAEIVVIKKAS